MQCPQTKPGLTSVNRPGLVESDPSRAENPAAVRNTPQTIGSHLRDGGTHIRIERAIDGDGTVVVECEHATLHRVASFFRPSYGVRRLLRQATSASTSAFGSLLYALLLTFGFISRGATIHLRISSSVSLVPTPSSGYRLFPTPAMEWQVWHFCSRYSGQL